MESSWLNLPKEVDSNAYAMVAGVVEEMINRKELDDLEQNRSSFGAGSSAESDAIRAVVHEELRANDAIPCAVSA